MQTQFWTDSSLVEAIQQGGPRRENALRHIYQMPGLRETVIRHVLDGGGAMADAKDVFQDALVLFDRNLREGRFEGKSSLKTYFVSIAKWHWLTLRRKAGRYEALSPAQYDAEIESVETSLLGDEERAQLAFALEQTGSRCRDLLKLYQLDYSMEEIARLLNYSGADTAKKEAWRCRMKLRDALQQMGFQS